MKKLSQNSLEVVSDKGLIRICPPKRINKIKDARRLLANLIYQFQKGEVSSEYLKTLCYALIKYSELFKAESLVTLQEKLSEIEERLNGLKKIS